MIGGYRCSACGIPIVDTSAMRCTNCGVDFRQVGPTPVPASDPVVTTGWTTPAPRRRGRAGRVALVLVIIGFVAALGLGVTVLGNVHFYGGIFVKPDPGTILFGSDLAPGNEMVINPTTTAGPGDTLVLVGVFTRAASGDLLIEAQRGTDPAEQLGTFQAAQSVNYLYITDLRIATLGGPGHYVFRIRSGSEVLAQGALDVTGSATPSGLTARTSPRPDVGGSAGRVRPERAEAARR